MKHSQIALLMVVIGIILLPTVGMAIPTTFAQTGQTTSDPQFTILNTGGTVTVSGMGQDFFTYLIGGTPFGAPVLANFTLTATSSEFGSCGSSGCPNGDTFVEQGFVGSFSYIVASGTFAGMNLLSGTFGVNGTPANSGGNLNETTGGTGGSYLSTQTGPNPTGVILTSDFLDFSGVSVESASWAFSGLGPNFAVDATGTTLSKPLLDQAFTAAAVGTFASEPPPTGQGGAPEPETMLLLGSALLGLGLIARKRLPQ